MFKDLIKELKKVKTAKDFTPELSFELTSAAITAHLESLAMQYDELDPEEAFDMTRSMILKQLDNTLINLVMSNDNFADGLDIAGDNPMEDPILGEAIQKAMNEYNDRLEKKPNMKNL